MCCYLFFKRQSGTDAFLVNFAKFLRTPFIKSALDNVADFNNFCSKNLMCSLTKSLTLYDVELLFDNFYTPSKIRKK